MKKIIAILLTFVFLFTLTAIPSMAEEAPVGVVGYSDARVVKVDLTDVTDIMNYDAEISEFKITSTEGLLELLRLTSPVAGGGENLDFKDLTVYLANDIDLSTIENFTPLMNFKGTFDGQGNTVKNLKISNTAASGVAKVGLFGTLVDGTVKNLIIDAGSEIRYTGIHTDVRIAAIVGSLATNAVVDNCHNMGKVFGGRYTGGVVGFIESATPNVISNCTNSGDVTANTPDNNCIAGGILGMAAVEKTLVKNCRNTGNITSIGGSNINAPAGGIVGRCWSANLVIDGCINNGNITAGKAASSAGGILGAFQLHNVIMKNCINYGILSATKTGLWAHQNNADAFVIETNNFNKAGDADPTLETDLENTAISYRGIQKTAVYEKDSADVLNVRFVAVGWDMSYKSVGFEIESTSHTGKAWNETTTTVFASLLATTPDGQAAESISASSFGAAYIYVAVIQGIPDGEEVVLKVTPYAVDKNDTTISGETYIVTIAPDGTVTQVLDA